MRTGARLGLVVPPAANVVPPEARELFGDQLDVVARGLGIPAMTAEEFDFGLERLDSAVADLVEAGAQAVSVMGTSLTFYRGREGNEEVLERLRVAGGGLPVTTMSSSVVQALRRLQARRIAVVAAYSDDLTERLVRFLVDYGVEAASTVPLGVERMTDIGSVGDAGLESAAAQALDAAGRADALLISCGGLRTVRVGQRLERALGVPVVSSSVDGMRGAAALLR